ncbi:hypothetical protein HOK68_02240 [Candidatus Woesearchaeota archaeon]|mgnify:CR=1 FL=1|jgi:DNA-directed RNA polymerase subunit F|nr:hypothetical protein [Candidatus Woesearchaeota archaeon]MBT4388026.1 hypothetical protein [Candidatus Woesearchaeota archaeon]MBT4596291.1 hypothetical protein [Candidatus Woesearchaeota archaeon]MBT5740793.1 hypothetical protein [Candidatus Woesearchaeota archaeon]MBT6505573.1 hypothetical protein [Candidatus Woesearchaeota archaeon]
MSDEFDLIEKTPVSLSELKETLDEIKERDGELNFRGNRTVDYLNNVPVMSKENRNKFFDELKALDYSRLKVEIISKLADFLPQNEDELDLVMKSFSTVTLTKEQLLKLLEICKNYSFE